MVDEEEAELPEGWGSRHLPRHIGIGSGTQAILDLGHVEGVYSQYQLLVDLCLPHLLANLPNRYGETEEQPNKQQEEMR